MGVVKFSLARIRLLFQSNLKWVKAEMQRKYTICCVKKLMKRIDKNKRNNLLTSGLVIK